MKKETPSGIDILHDPRFNKGTAFTDRERDALRLRGLLPPRVNSMEEQLVRVLGNFRRKESDIEKYIFLTALQDRNETLFYRFILNHIEEMLPIVYTPTVGQACKEFSGIFRRPRGLYVSAEDRGRVVQILRNWPEPEVDVVVVTDGERILGLGDLGADGMGIPIGKLSLYTALAGIDPRRCLPVMLDVGTGDETRRHHPLYMGLRRERLRGEEYDELVEEFVMGIQEVFPAALIQFEDFGNRNAFRLLAKYRDRVCTFNDDIQGTAAVALAGLISAQRITGAALEDQRFVFFGAGEAAIGIADLVSSALRRKGLPEEEARRRCWFIDSKGLVVESRTDLAPHKQPYAHQHAPVRDLVDVIDTVRPTGLIGVSGQPHTFTRDAIERMAAINQRPVIFALSNPTSKSECTAEQAYQWSKGRAVFASGSPFPPVEYDGRTFVPGQGNNAYIFPGVGLGVVACGARHVTDEMFFAASETLAAQVMDTSLEQGTIYPPLKGIRDVSVKI
ncbi:MAG: NAD-dependent malic enzyme, partial [Gemmatimonadales bacterium]